MGLFGPPNIEKMKSKKDINGLIKALSSKNNNDIRKAAVIALGEIGDANAVSHLVRLLRFADMKPAAMAALVQIGEPTTDYLSKYRLTKETIELLEKIGNKTAIELLLIGVNKPDDNEVMQNAVGALVRIGEPVVLRIISRIRNYNFISLVFKESLNGLREILKKIGGDRTAILLCSSLEGADQDARRYIARSLGDIGGEYALEGLITLLKDKETSVIKAAIEALVKLDNPVEAAPGLITLLKDKETSVIKAAVEGLVKLGNPAAAAPGFIALLKDKSVAIRKEAAVNLGEIGNQAAVIPLTNLLKDEENSVIKAAIEALVKLGNPVVVEKFIPLLKHKGYDVRERIAISLGMIGDQNATEPLLSSLIDESIDVRTAAANALDKLGWQPDQGKHAAAYWAVRRKWDFCIKNGADAVEPLLTALESDYDEFQKDIIDALIKLGDPRAMIPLTRTVIPLISKLMHNYNVRKDAAHSLVALYQSGNLDEQTQHLILAQKSIISEKHTDGPGNHVDRSDNPNDCAHSDFPHEDSGIGINFPV